MIFYFSGTGNSLSVAKAIQKDGEQLVNMVDAYREKAFDYKVAEGETVAFVFPVYFYSLNDVIYRFAKKLNLEGADYVYAIVTCGASIGQAGDYLAELLAKRKVKLSNVYPLVMPDNGILYYNLDTREENAEKLTKADADIAAIMAKVEARESSEFGSALTSKLGRQLYHAMNGTKAFNVSDACISCGMCERNCPDEVIVLKDGKPEWVKKHCTKCSACINRCPVEAIQYGKKTKKRNRYSHPDY